MSNHNGLNHREIKKLSLLLKGCNNVQLVWFKAMIESEQEARK